jgi:DNA-binding transcriptional ArsR family regulator
MMEENKFITIVTLLAEPARAKMLWNLLDGRAYTAGELALAADISVTSASNHLSKLLDADLLKAEAQGRHRYFSFSRPEVAYAVESMASLGGEHVYKSKDKTKVPGIKHCRSCYDHLAGYVGVQITEAFETRKLIKKSGTEYSITGKGWKWFSDLGINEKDIPNKRRPLTRQCLDWSERRPHLAGQIGALLLNSMLEKAWFKRVQFSRELIITSKGRNEIYELLSIEV